VKRDRDQRVTDGPPGERLDLLLARARWPELTAEATARLEDRFRRLRRGRRAPLWMAAAAAILITAAGIVMWASHTGRRTPDQPKPVAVGSAGQDDDLRDELGRAEAEADVRATVVERMLALEAALVRQGELQRLDARLERAERVALDLDEAVGVIAYNADRVGKREGGRETAIAAYREIIRMFSASRWAELGRKRLDKIQNS